MRSVTQTPAYSWRHALHRVRRNLLLILVAGLIGAVLGILVVSGHPAYKATVLLGVRTSGDVSTSTATESAAVSIVSPAIIDKAARALGVDPGVLASQVTADVQSGTTLIDLTAANTDSAAAVRNVTTLADVAIQGYVDRSAAIAADVRDAGEKQLKTGALSDVAAERTRTESIGSTVGTAQGQSITGAVTISVVSPALSAHLAGVSRPVGVILGTAMGVLLALLVVLSGGWRRIGRVRSPADLEEIGGARAVLSAEDVDGLTGAVLASGEDYVVLAGADEASRRATAIGLVGGLRRNGYTVGRVSVLGAPSDQLPLTRGEGDTWSIGAQTPDPVLAHSARGTLRGVVKADLTVVDIPDLSSALVYLAGQSDFVPILMVPAGRRVGAVANDLRPIQAASPILVVVRRGKRRRG